MVKKTYCLFLLIFSVAFVMHPTIAFLAENEVIDRQFNEFMESSIQSLSNMDLKQVLNRTEDAAKNLAMHLREMGYEVPADDKFLDSKFDELYKSMEGVNVSEKDLKRITEAASLTFKDLFGFIGNNVVGNKAQDISESEFQNDFLNKFLSYINGNKDTSQVSTPTTGLAAPITIAFSIVRALIGGLAGGGALGALLAAAMLTAADFGVSVVQMILGAIIGGTVLGITGLLLGGIIIAILGSFIGFLIPVIVALMIAVLVGLAVTSLAALIIPIAEAFLSVITGIFGGGGDFFSGIVTVFTTAGIGVVTAFLVFIVLAIVFIPIEILLGIGGLIIGIPVGIIFGSLIGGIGGMLVGGAVGGLGGIFVAQLAFLPLIVFVALFTFVLGTAAYMAFDPILGTTNDYLTPMSKGIYSIYVQYENMDGLEVVNNIDQLLKDFLDVAKSAFGPKMYNTIKTLEIIVDTTDFTDAEDIGRAAEETLNLLPAIVK